MPSTPPPRAAAPAALSGKRLSAWGALIAIGMIWGVTGPLSKIAVSTGHSAIAITFWSALIGALTLTGVLLLRGKRLPLGRRHLLYFLVCGLLGTALPNSLSYASYNHLPVGVIVMMLGLVPMATLMLAWPLGLDRPTPKRLLGIALGALAVGLIVLPDSSLPKPGQAVWLALPVIVAAAYAAENVVIAKYAPKLAAAQAEERRGKGGGPFTTLCGFSWAAALLLTPTMIATAGWFDITVFGAAERAVVVNAFLHLLAYAGFIWLIGQAGPVFASQVGYVVTATGVLLGMLLFDERHSAWVWLAIVTMMTGLALVQPRKSRA